MLVVGLDWTEPTRSGRTYRVAMGWDESGRIAHVAVTAKDGGEVTPTLWRRIPFARITADLGEQVADIRRAQATPEGAARRPVAFFTGRSEPTKPKRGRPHARGDEFYLRVAADYREATSVQGREAARKPAHAVAAALGPDVFSPTQQADPSAAAAQVRKWVSECRRRGLLPPAE